MAYAVKEIFYSLQGEGAHTGRPALFCRFAGCNLWSGREEDRDAAACTFCDTDFVGVDGENGGKFADAHALADALDARWPDASPVHKFIVCTGGEPLLQLDDALIAALHDKGFEIAVETNGTQVAPAGLDWICVSPKGREPLVQTTGNELKLIFPQAESEARPENFEGLAFDHFFLQPLDGPDAKANAEACVAYCKAHPKWRLSLQTHKFLDIP